MKLPPISFIYTSEKPQHKQAYLLPLKGKNLDIIKHKNLLYIIYVLKLFEWTSIGEATPQ